MHYSFCNFIVRLGMGPPDARLLGVPTFPVERSSEGVVADGCVFGRVASLLSLLSSQQAGLKASHLGFGWVWV